MISDSIMPIQRVLLFASNVNNERSCYVWYILIGHLRLLILIVLLISLYLGR